MEEEEFTAWIGSAIGAMHGLAISISIIGHTAHLRKSTTTHARLVGASARDAISIIDSLARDQYRNGGIDGMSSLTIRQVKRCSGCWLDRTFRSALEDMKAARAKKPKIIFETIEHMRRDATAHFPIVGQSRLNPTGITAEDLWQAYWWLKEMLGVWLSCMRPLYEWVDEKDIHDQVLLDLSAPIVSQRLPTA